MTSTQELQDQRQPPRLTEVDFMSPEFANNRNKYIPGILRDLPVFYYDPMNIWVVSKHEDVKNGFFDSATYSSSAWGCSHLPMTSHRAFKT